MIVWVRRSLWLSSFSLLFLAGCRQSADTDRDVLVFAAASLGDSLTEIGASFETETGHRVVFNFAGSQSLAQQIVASGRGDLFVSADNAWMDFIEEKGQVKAGSRQPLLANRLVIICGANGDFRMSTPDDLASLEFRYLCIGEPDAVPVGRYAKAWLENGGLWEAVRERVSPTPNVRAALEQAISRSDAIGIVYSTEVIRAASRAKLLWKMTEPTVRYPMALLDEGVQSEGANRFYDYLQSDAAKRVFETYGFEVL
ncbi:MAG: molybdate ABC transporter substrate-binding protein [Opitutales bacterium TMED158]|nr:MAG: molybdate ABC transporter substrate-binding protein [Opitutales bacterium TMED158]